MIAFAHLQALLCTNLYIQCNVCALYYERRPGNITIPQKVVYNKDLRPKGLKKLMKFNNARTTICNHKIINFVL